jgi:Na+ dependent nucleoside transporter N-terminus.
MDILSITQIIIGFVGLIIIAIPFSENFKIINFKYIVYGILAQIVLADNSFKNPKLLLALLNY